MIVELVLEMQKNFNKKLEALEQENNLFKAQFTKTNDLEEEESTKNGMGGSKYQEGSGTKK